MNCGGLTDPVNGVVSFTMTTFRSEANYSCNLGYLLEGVGSRTCQADRMWSDTMPVCERELIFVLETQSQHVRDVTSIPNFVSTL